MLKSLMYYTPILDKGHNQPFHMLYYIGIDRGEREVQGVAVRQPKALQGGQPRRHSKVPG
jgi:hypothetical protein